MKVAKIIFGLFIAQVLCLFVPQTVFCQVETLDIIQYTPPKGWTRSQKEGVMIFSDTNKTTNCGDSLAGWRPRHFPGIRRCGDEFGRSLLKRIVENRK